MAKQDEASWLDPAWNQRGLNALRATLDVDGDTKRRMIEFLFDAGLWDRDRLSWAAAVTRWNACMNPAKPDFFKLSEVWALMKRFHRTALFEVMAQDLGFELRPVPTEARRQAVLERLVAAQERQAQAMEAASAELRRLGMPEDAVRLDAAMDGLGPKFDMPCQPPRCGGF